MNLGNFVAAFAIVIAQLALDGLHLFIQIIFALGLFHLALHAATDFLFDLQYAQFAFHKGKRHFQPAKRVSFNQQRLLIRYLQLDIGRNGVRQRRWRFDLRKLHRGFGGHFLVELRIIFKLVSDRTHQRGGFRTFSILFDNKGYCRFDIFAAVLNQIAQLRALLAFDQNTHSTVGQL